MFTEIYSRFLDVLESLSKKVLENNIAKLKNCNAKDFRPKYKEYALLSLVISLARKFKFYSN